MNIIVKAAHIRRIKILQAKPVKISLILPSTWSSAKIPSIEAYVSTMGTNMGSMLAKKREAKSFVLLMGKEWKKSLPERL